MGPPKEPPIPGFEQAGFRNVDINVVPCRSCGARIFFAKGASGRSIPLDLPSKLVYVFNADLGGWVTARGHESHFATCPQADRWRRNKEGKGDAAGQ